MEGNFRLAGGLVLAGGQRVEDGLRSLFCVVQTWCGQSLTWLDFDVNFVGSLMWGVVEDGDSVHLFCATSAAA